MMPEIFRLCTVFDPAAASFPYAMVLGVFRAVKMGREPARLCARRYLAGSIISRYVVRARSAAARCKGVSPACGGVTNARWVNS